jgi:RNA polymerase sigma-70 factor, ECF subfamily
LHDVFDRGYDDIATVLGKSEAACRQMVHRARERVREDRRRFETTEADRVRLVKRFTEAAEARDERTLLALFAPDATWTADGGGKTAAAPYPLTGAERIVKLVLGLSAQFERRGARMHLAAVNGETGVVVRFEGRISSAMSFGIEGDRIRAVYAVLNPDKLPVQ